MMKISGTLLGVIGLGLTATAAMAQGSPFPPTIGGPSGQGNSPYVGQTVGGSGGPTGSSINTPGGSGQGPLVTNNPHFGGAPVGGGGGQGLTGKKK